MSGFEGIIENEEVDSDDETTDDPIERALLEERGLNNASDEDLDEESPEIEDFDDDNQLI
jgi:hypothetical protein